MDFCCLNIVNERVHVGVPCGVYDSLRLQTPRYTHILNGTSQQTNQILFSLSLLTCSLAPRSSLSACADYVLEGVHGYGYDSC